MSNKYQALLLIGPPGSGKGTIGKKLALVTDQLHLSSGDIFRSLDKNSPNGILQRQYTDKGQLVPDEITIKIVLAHIQNLINTNVFNPEKQKIILDGIPRTLLQAQMMQETFDFKKILVLDIPDKQILFDRIKKRALIEGRTDDMDQAVLENRYNIYKNQTEVLLNYFPESIQVHINADQKPIPVLRDVLTKVSDFFS
jgi:adenylate kinase